MKKIICLLATAFLAINVLCAKNFFSSRFFEVKVDVPFNISNNLFSLNDILVENLEIDLRKIADDLPKEGFTAIVEANPNFSMNFNIAGVSVGTKMGANTYLKFNISRELFDFLGYGYKAGETLEVKINPAIDLFAFVEIPISFDVSRFRIGVTPSVFLPIATVDNCNAVASASNGADGSYLARLNADMNVYTSGIYDVVTGATTFDNINIGDYLGFDLGGFFQMPILEDMNLKIDAKVPIIPGKLDRNVNMNFEMEVKGNVMDFITPPAPTEPDGTTPPDSSTPEAETNQPSMPNGIPPATILAEPYYSNRPMKVFASVIYKPIGFLTLEGGGGIGIRRPFTENYYCFAEYYAAVTASLFDIIRAKVSTEYRDEIFKHELDAIVSLRFVEIEAGVSFQANSFKQSFNAAGLGAHVTASVGF